MINTKCSIHCSLLSHCILCVPGSMYFKIWATNARSKNIGPLSYSVAQPTWLSKTWLFRLRPAKKKDNMNSKSKANFWDELGGSG